MQQQEEQSEWSKITGVQVVQVGAKQEDQADGTATLLLCKTGQSVAQVQELKRNGSKERKAEEQNTPRYGRIEWRGAKDVVGAGNNRKRRTKNQVAKRWGTASK